MKKYIKKSKHQKSTSKKSLAKMTSSRIATMKVIDKEGSIKFLFDATSGNYVIFDNYNLSSYYSVNYYVAARFFNERITINHMI